MAKITVYTYEDSMTILLGNLCVNEINLMKQLIAYKTLCTMLEKPQAKELHLDGRPSDLYEALYVLGANFDMTVR